MRSTMLKASMAIAAASTFATLTADTVSAAGKVKVVYCKVDGKESYHKFQSIPDAARDVCKIKMTDGLIAGKIKITDDGLSKFKGD